MCRLIAHLALHASEVEVSCNEGCEIFVIFSNDDQWLRAGGVFIDLT